MRVWVLLDWEDMTSDDSLVVGVYRDHRRAHLAINDCLMKDLEVPNYPERFDIVEATLDTWEVADAPKERER